MSSGDSHRTLIIQLKADQPKIFAAASLSDWAGDILPWEGVDFLSWFLLTINR